MVQGVLFDLMIMANKEPPRCYKKITVMFLFLLFCSEQADNLSDKTLASERERKMTKKVIKKGYIEVVDIQLVKSIVYMFEIEKEDNISMIYI